MVQSWSPFRSNYHYINKDSVLIYLPQMLKRPLLHNFLLLRRTIQVKDPGIEGLDLPTVGGQDLQGFPLRDRGILLERFVLRFEIGEAPRMSVHDQERFVGLARVEDGHVRPRNVLAEGADPELEAVLEGVVVYDVSEERRRTIEKLRWSCEDFSVVLGYFSRRKMGCEIVLIGSVCTNYIVCFYEIPPSFISLSRNIKATELTF